MKSTCEITLGKKTIKENEKPYVIAEIGVNHEGSLELAKKLIDLAKEGGADAAKFQSYKADTLASKNSPSYWDLKKEPTKSQHELFKKYDTFCPDDYIELSKYCKSKNIDFLSTPFDDESIEYLSGLVPFYKIASADITNLPFLKKIALKKKPVVLSTGASTKEEINEAVEQLNGNGVKDIALLHCILNYPTSFKDAHLRMITDLARDYPHHVIGYSDHTLPDSNMTSLVTAHLLGALIIEKHFTHDKSLPGNDHYHAMNKDDLEVFLKIINKIHLSLGNEYEKKPIKSEEISRLNARRSIVVKRDIKNRHKLLENDLTYKRPGTGISPAEWDKVIGKKVAKDLKADHVLLWSDLVDPNK